MTLELHTNPAVFEQLAAEWDALLSPENSLNFFMRTDWQRTWWKHLHRGDLAVYALRDAGRLVGVAPLFVEAVGGQRMVHVVGCVDITDYIDLVAAPGREEDLIAALLDALTTSGAPAWDALQMCNVPGSSPTLEILPGLAAARGLRVESRVEDVCPVVTLPGDYEQYLETLDKKQRHELRRKRRRAEAYPVTWYRVGPQHDLDAEIEAFLHLMGLSTLEKAEFLRQRGHRNFFKEMGPLAFKQGMLDLSFLVVEGQRVAAMWNFAYGRRMMLYNSGLDPTASMQLSPGIVLLTFNIEDSIRRGFAAYDFLQGDEEYKFRMGAQATTVHTLTVTR